MKQNLKYTPGPWIQGEGTTYWTIFDFDHYPITELRLGKAEAEANARLIVAAPELLEALNAARAVLTCILGTDAESQIIAEQIGRIDAALTKAGVEP